MSKGLEELEILKFLVDNCSHFEFDFTNIEKELKALEIIKMKKVDVWLFSNNDNFNDYNWALYLCFHREDSEKCSLTEEEYDLLKEVLL